MTWKQFLCAMTGHSIITRSQQGQRFFACYACDRKLSRGWDLRTKDTKGNSVALGNPAGAHSLSLTPVDAREL
jgi:hypothetical protein